MINISDGELANILPIQFIRQPQVLAFSYALKQAYKQLLAYQARLLVYANIDEAQENVLDYLAIELQIWGYRQELSIERKREIIKKAFEAALANGTRHALDYIINAAYETVELKEWFEYSGDPGFFRIRVDAESGYDVDTLLDAIEKRKRKSAHLDAVELLTRSNYWIGLAVMAHERRKVSTDEITIDSITWYGDADNQIYTDDDNNILIM